MHESEGKRRLLLTEERREYILALLQREGKVLAVDLSRALGVSDDTIRRDLDVLAEGGRLRRVHGGALRPAPINDDYVARQSEGAVAKASIAGATAALIRPGHVAILDAGTTTLEVARHLPRDLQATIVTNSVPVAVALARHEGIEVIIIGGRLYRYSMASVGAAAVEALRSIRADICIMGVLGLHPELGISVLDREESYVKRAMVEGSADVVAVATADKLGTEGPYVVCSPAALTHLVTEIGVPEETLAPYRALGLTIIQG